MAPAALPVDALQPSAEHSSGTMKIENTEKRDSLVATEKKFQELWLRDGVFQSDAPSIKEFPPNSVTPAELHQKFPKFFGTMAYPYVNGTPHLGHAFTVSKIDFASRVARMQGKRTLYPQGYHCTGMPIKACADKLTRELEMFGQNFERCKDEETVEPDSAQSIPIHAPPEAQTDVTKFTNVKKGKAALKTTKAKYQWQVLLSLGIPLEQIHKFADADYWLRYFPQLWQKHLSEFGCGIDWRRSFVTTPANPYYSAFVEWQMRRLKSLDKIQFGKRYTVYSPKDGQPCLDHDRASGEGVLVQEYTGIRCRVKVWSERAQETLKGNLPATANVFMVPATLRPETMYGQTNVFVSPKITYGIFQASETDYFLITPRAARNMAFQGIFKDWGTFPQVAAIQGEDLIGSLVSAPLSRQGDVYVVPMDTIKESKGTGVVTSVPSDSPDDYAMHVELSKKADFYNIKKEWIPQDILPIIETPYGNLTAPTLVKQMKINSPKDAKQLAEAKDLAYKEGFYKGKMIYGEFAGKSVEEAKPMVRRTLLDSGDAFVYCEPDGLVISRSGDECVAAHLDQWFLTYGTDGWRNEVLDHVNNKDGLGFNAFTTETKHAIEQTLGWMNQWAVTRQYGLGTKLPWDKSQLVESLSDSTIYMAYYTIAHYLHSDIYGTQKGIGNIKVEQMTDGVWDYVFGITNEVSGGTKIPEETLAAMRREFTYWYPLDVRISGKDLINNHLIFFLYIHQAIWGNAAPQYLPKGIRINGHATLNGEKMSKSTGNFLTLDAAVNKFGADATRVALADAGDGVEDANFEETVANATILKMFELRKWIEDAINDAHVLKPGQDYEELRKSARNQEVILRSGEKTFWDELFENELNILVNETVEAYGSTLYKLALKSGFYDLTAARDSYRVSATSAGIGMHQECIRRYVELQALLISPLAPHFADYIWQGVLRKSGTVQQARFPTVPAPNPVLTAQSNYIRNTSSAIGSAEGVQQKRLAKGKSTFYDPKQDKQLTIFVAKSWPAWQEKYLKLMQEHFDGMSLDVKSVRDKMDKSEMKKGMAFVQQVKKRLDGGEDKDEVFSRRLIFDEVQVLREMIPGLKATVLKLKRVDVILVDESGKTGTKIGDDGAEHKVEGLSQTAASAEPGNPTFEFANIATAIDGV